MKRASWSFMARPDLERSLCERAGLRVLKLRSHGVRFRTNEAARLRGAAHWWEELRKLPYSAASRFTLRGETSSVLAQRR